MATFFPLTDTQLYKPQPRPREKKFTTIGQWSWDGAVEVDGEFPDLSKRFAFERYLDLPRLVPETVLELAMNIGDDESEREKLRAHGWRLADPHAVARTPPSTALLRSALGEFTAIKGVDVSWRTGWISDRAAAFMALGRPAITENTGAERYLPAESGLFFVGNAEEAAETIRRILKDWPAWAKKARACAVEIFDSGKNLRKILQL